MTTSLGQSGEDYIAAYVEQLGWKILARNVHFRSGEIDLIAEDRGEIVFAEVKTRSNARYGSPAESVSRSKLRKITLSAQLYLLRRHWETRPYRLDVFGVQYKDGTFSVDHLPNVS